MEPRKVVVRYADGRIVKGSTLDFSPTKPGFHLFPVGTAPPGKAVEVAIHELKAVFFVRDFAGRPQYQERKQFGETERPLGRKVEVRFKDGETLVGYTVSYDPKRPGFILCPADPESNNLSVFVVFAAVQKIRDISPGGHPGSSAQHPSGTRSG